MKFDYITDPDEIYRISFETIEAECDLSQVPEDLKSTVIRMVHASGDTGLSKYVGFSPDAAVAGKAALNRGARIFTDVKMVGHGISRPNLVEGTEIVTLVDHPDIAAAAKRQGTTRSAAAVDVWGDAIEGSIVAIGNAPTALFRLLEVMSEGGPKPALIIGMPVGFVGAAESKDALVDHSCGVPFITVRGRRGGSPLAASALNALAIAAKAERNGETA
jgi:precorrin-8X/cobalt-precorrin-8 methylmutase